MKAQPYYSKEEFARRGDEIYERKLRPTLEKGNEGKFIAIDIETGAYEVDSDELSASDRLLARVPNAQIWLRRIGSRYARHLGPIHSGSTVNKAPPSANAAPSQKAKKGHSSFSLSCRSLTLGSTEISTF
jgi:hypothetical protein